MKKIILIMIILFSFSLADSVLLIKKGWQLVGSSTTVDVASTFTDANVEQVWHFNAPTQTWLGYSPDANISARMQTQQIGKLITLKNWHGFWIKSKQDWTLIFKDSTLNEEPIAVSASDIIELKKGWNLISLPIDTVVSADIFDNMTAWKYNTQSRWELSDRDDSKEDFPRLGHIKNSDGIWVKVEEDNNISVAKEASKLHNFTTKEEMVAYIKEMAIIDRRPYCGIEPFFINSIGLRAELSDDVAEGGVTNAATPNASGTNLQENDVDESDIVKHNGRDLFYIGKDANNKRNHINVTTFSTLVQSDAPSLYQITFDENRTVDSFYLVDTTLVVISEQYAMYHAQGRTTAAQTFVDMFDVSTISAIKKLKSYVIDGSLKNSRVLNNTLYAITSFSPKYEINYPKEYLTPSDSCKRLLDGRVVNADYADISYAECYNIVKDENRYYRYNYDAPEVTFTDLLPEIEGTSLTKQTLVTPQRLYASAKQNQASSMTSISAFSITDKAYQKTTSYVGDSSVEYASSKALYLLSYDYPHFFDFNNYKERSIVYKFGFDDDISYKAVGSVYGTPLNQFSLSEQGDILRLATTEGFSWSSTGTKNTLYTLEEESGLLNTKGVLSGLGKEGERIKSVRFMGNRAYLVTFRTTDPLYTIDISNPAAPKKMGELEVSGYSSYLHPIGEDKLLGIGREADEEGNRLGVKIELFDVSDFENPSSLDSIVLEDTTSSELEFNHKALAYRTSDNLFAFPYSDYGIIKDNYLGIFQVEGDVLSKYDALASSSNGWGEHRGVIFDLNTTTYVSFFADDTVITTPLTRKED